MHFLHKSSSKLCRERLKDEASTRIVDHLQQNTKQYLTKKKPHEILWRSTSKSLLEMSRLDSANRQKNQNFEVNLKRKLTLELWPQKDVVICACGQRMDRFGDHAFRCNHTSETTMSNEIRDGIIRLLKNLLPTVHSYNILNRCACHVHLISSPLRTGRRY